jgi:hypothetical protein
VYVPSSTTLGPDLRWWELRGKRQAIVLPASTPVGADEQREFGDAIAKHAEEYGFGHVAAPQHQQIADFAQVVLRHAERYLASPIVDAGVALLFDPIGQAVVDVTRLFEAEPPDAEERFPWSSARPAQFYGSFSNAEWTQRIRSEVSVLVYTHLADSEAAREAVAATARAGVMRILCAEKVRLDVPVVVVNSVAAPEAPTYLAKTLHERGIVALMTPRDDAAAVSVGPVIVLRRPHNTESGQKEGFLILAQGGDARSADAIQERWLEWQGMLDSSESAAEGSGLADLGFQDL